MMRKLQYVAALSLFVLSACNTTPNGSVPTFEAAYCSTQIFIPDPVTVTGRAVYKRREFTGSGLGSVDSAEYPIRHAEIVVRVIGTGGTVQCGVTNTLGYFSLQV